MKALILAGGRGSRLGAATADRNKCMCRYQGRYIIENSLENSLAVGAEEIVLLVGYQAETIINEIGISFRGVPIRYVIQWERGGVVHAIECCREAIGGSDFCLLLADEVFSSPRHQEMRDLFDREPDLFGVCGTVRVADRSLISKTYAVMTDEASGRIHRLIEKPRNPINDIKGSGNCLFRNEIFDYIPFTPINQQRQERELPDLIQCAIDDGKKVKAFNIADAYTNVNTLEELSGPLAT